MPEILIRCPLTKKQLSTGIALAEDVFAVADFNGQAVRCPHCAMMHSWTKRDAFLRR